MILHSLESLFALVGGGQRQFYCYLIGQNTWSERASSLLDQNDGSSITSGRKGRRLYAIFGTSTSIERHYKYGISSNLWYPEDDLPAILGSGASITCDPIRDDAYLVIGGGRDGFYINTSPSEEEEEGPQSQEAIPISPKSRISFAKDRLIIHYSTDAPSRVKIQIYDLAGRLIKTLFNENVQKGEYQVT